MVNVILRSVGNAKEDVNLKKEAVGQSGLGHNDMDFKKGPTRESCERKKETNQMKPPEGSNRQCRALGSCTASTTKATIKQF